MNNVEKAEMRRVFGEFVVMVFCHRGIGNPTVSEIVAVGKALCIGFELPEEECRDACVSVAKAFATYRELQPTAPTEQAN